MLRKTYIVFNLQRTGRQSLTHTTGNKSVGLLLHGFALLRKRHKLLTSVLLAPHVGAWIETLFSNYLESNIEVELYLSVRYQSQCKVYE